MTDFGKLDEPDDDPRPASTTLLTYEQAAHRTGLPRGTLYSMVAAHAVPHIRLGKRLVRFSVAALEQWLEELRELLGKAGLRPD